MAKLSLTSENQADSVGASANEEIPAIQVKKYNKVRRRGKN